MTDETAVSTSPTYKIALAGFGHMGSAMAKGWSAAGLIESIDILDPSLQPESADYIPASTLHSNDDAFLKKAKSWDVLILAIKPQVLDDFIAGHEDDLPEGLPIISILAGKTVMDISHKFRKSHPVIRAMPNTPASIGKGMTVACANSLTQPAQRMMTEHLMSSMGKFAWAKNEDLMDAVTALSGSGPAYILHMVEAMAKAGVSAGLDADFAMMLARQTLIGTAALAEKEEGKTPEELRRQVTSPNGTTAAGLSVLMDGRFETTLRETLLRAKARSQELSSS
jgi:pyrroline-5-carboxylate reductase